CLLCESRPASTQGIASNIRAMAVAGSQSLPAVYDAVPGPLDTIVSFSLLFLLLVYKRARPRIRAHRTALVVVLLFAVIYGLGLLLLRPVVEFDSLDPRLVAPAALPIVAAALAAAFWHVDRRARPAVAAIAVVLFASSGLVTSRLVAWRGLS